MTVGCNVYFSDGHELMSLPFEYNSVPRAVMPQTAVKRASSPDQGIVLARPIDHSLQGCRGSYDGAAMVEGDEAPWCRQRQSIC